MSFNIRYAAAQDEGNSWGHRKALVVGRVRAFDPDLLGVQECLAGAQAEYVRTHLPQYELYGIEGDTSDAAAEMAPVLYKKEVFEETRRGHFWLSETPYLWGSRSWDSWFARAAVWTELLHKPSGRSLIFLNTHIDPAPAAADESAALLGHWVAARERHHPLIVTGDFNVDKNGLTYSWLLARALVFDVHRRLHPDRNPEPTYHGYGGAMEQAPLDGILASRHFRATAADIDTYHDGALFPSDHYPMTAVLDWQDAPEAAPG